MDCCVVCLLLVGMKLKEHDALKAFADGVLGKSVRFEVGKER